MIRKNISRNRFWYLGAVALLIATIILGYFVLKIEEEDTDLSVDEVYFVTEELGGLDTDIKIIVFLTNDGKTDIDNVKVRAFVIEKDSNLARDEDETFLGRIEGKKTLEGELHVSVPNNDTYRIELLVFEDSKLSIRGSGSIDLKGVGVATDYQNYNDSANGNSLGWSDAEASDNASLAVFSGLCALIIPAVIIIIVIVVIVKQSKKERLIKDEEAFKPPEGSSAHRARPLERIATFDESEKEDIREEEKE